MIKKALIFLGCFTLLLLGCKRIQQDLPQKEAAEIRVGFSIATDTFIIERWNKDIKIFTGAVRDLGAEVLLQFSAGGAKAQIDQIRYLVEKEVDVLVVLAHDTSLLAGVIQEVREQDIPVLAYDRLIQGVPVDAYISFDNREVGRLFGKALLNEDPRGKYLIVNGSVRDNNSYEVNKGLHSVLDPAINAGRISLVDEIWLDQWSGDEAREEIQRVFDTGAEIDAISAGNDQIANAAIQLLAEKRIAGEVSVVGQDADLLSCQRVLEGLQLMTVYKPIGILATKAAQLALDLALDQLPEPDRWIENGGGSRIPFFIEHPIAVYRENMDETVIRDGFHSRDDVYREIEQN